jgi:spondin N/PEP-CTERM motif-containing protein
MRMVLSRTYLRAIVLAWPLVAVAVAVAAASASGGEIQISVTNNQPKGGFALSTVWVGLHDGTFSTFSSGAAASPALEAVAELGDSTMLQAAFTGHGVQTTVGATPNLPGTTASTVLNILNPGANQFLSFAAMVVPSNDFFMGNADPKAFQIFDSAGNFLGPKTIQIFGANVWDAGTEADNIKFGAAFVVGDNATDHVAENGTVSPVFGGNTDLTSYLNSIVGVTTPAGYDISHLISSGDLVATITISAVPEPSAMILLGTGIAGVIFSARRRRARNRS